MLKVKQKSKKNFDFLLLNRLLLFVRPYKFTFIFVMLSAILLSVFSTLSPYLLKITIDDYITVRDYNGMLFLISLMICTLFLEVIFQFLFIYNANWLGQNVILDIRNSLFSHIIYFKMNFFNNTPVGRMVTRVVNDIETISGIFSQGLFMIIADLLKMLIVIVVMLSVSWKLSLIVFTVLPFILIATKLFQISMKKAFNEVRNEVANLNTFVQERISGMTIVQLFNRQDEEYKSFMKINNKHRKAWLKTVWYNSIFFPIAELSTSITIGLIVWYGGLNVVLAKTNITLGIIFLFIQLSQMLFRPLRQIADKFNTLQMGMIAVKRVFDLIDKDERTSDYGDKSSSQIKGLVEFSNVNFSYVKGIRVLKNISFSISAGEKVAFVGETGAGKSTLINLLSRFYEINEGKILIDGLPISNYDLYDFRKKIGIVNQDVFLFADTIYNNITLWDSSIGFRDVVSAAKRIGVHDFIDSLPGKYDFNVKERGGVLSTGQRQLISFLRAYIKKPKILILDEATSSIDTQSELMIQKATKEVTKNKTSLVIAHRLSTIKKADKIIVMDKGSIVEIGCHKSLLLKSDGYYKKLHDAQFFRKK